MASTIPGNNLAPISFPGIASGIDYNSIIQKLTSLQLSQNTTYNTQITGLTSANAELIKINNLFISVQNSLTALSNPALYNAVSATESNPSVLTATPSQNVSATPGAYTIKSTTLATASQVTSSTAYGHSENDILSGSPASNIVLSASYVQIPPSNGDPTKGGAYVTVDGVKISYDVNTDSMVSLLSNINSLVQTVDPGFLATTAAGTDTVVFSSSDKPISLGSAGDNGNILQVFKLDQAQLVNTASSGIITAVAGVGGVQATEVFNSVNKFGGTTNANYVTPVTSGTFTINGVVFTVDNTKDALSDVISRINSSSAGVTAAFNQETGQITITNNATGPQSIVLGAPGDSSNFLSASGLTGAGANTSIGQQASVTLQNAAGVTSTVYSNSNQVSNAIPGLTLNLLQASATSSTLTVTSDTGSAVSAINAFVSAYNAALNEINSATTAPQVVPRAVGSPATASQSVGGGVLYGNSEVQSIKDSLTNIVAGLAPGTGYNSWSTVGLQISSTFSVVQPSSSASGGSQPFTTQTIGGTDGTLAPLNVATFQAALAANPSAVQSLFTGPSGIVTQLGAYLTGVTGQPTSLTSGLVGSIPATSLIQGFENSNTDQITSLQQQIQLITDNANSYADQLRASFRSSEGLIAGYQSLQSQLAGFFKNG